MTVTTNTSDRPNVIQLGGINLKLWRYHQHLCLEAWDINSAYAPLNRDDGGHRVKYGLDYFLNHFKGGGGGGEHTISTEGGVG